MAGIQGVEEVKEKRSKGCRNPRSGEPGGSMTPKGAGAQKWQKLKGWSFACRARVSPFSAQAESVSPPKLRLSEQTSSFSAQAESLPVRFPPHAGFLCFFGAFIAEFYIFYFYE